jgi:hypothetical protein
LGRKEGTTDRRRFDPQTYEEVANDLIVHIETRRRSGQTHRTPVGIVGFDGDVYVRGVYGAGSAWFGQLMDHPEATLHSAGRVIPVRAVLANDEGTVERFNEGYWNKYRNRDLLGRRSFQATARLEPA